MRTIIIGVTSNLYSAYGRQEKPAIYTPAPKGYAGAMVIKYVGSEHLFIKELEQFHRNSPEEPENSTWSRLKLLRPHQEKMYLFLRT